MTLGTWDPNTAATSASPTLDETLLTQLITIDRQHSTPQQSFDEQQRERLAPIMRLDKERWTEAAENLPDADLEALMRTLTLAEQLPGWEAGEHSPVIWLGKILKQRGTGISRDLLLWIKQHSDNRYLPHGPLL